MVMYERRQNGDTFEIPLNDPYRLACCDCGLVHEVVFKIHKGHLYMTIMRHNRATGQCRRFLKRHGRLIKFEDGGILIPGKVDQNGN